MHTAIWKYRVIFMHEKLYIFLGVDISKTVKIRLIFEFFVENSLRKDVKIL